MSNDFLNQTLVTEATIGEVSPGRHAEGAVAGLGGFTPAPVPDQDRDAPLQIPSGPSATHPSPKLFNNGREYHGEGYVFGSTVQEEEERKAGPTPGINLIMPLQ